MTDTPTVDSAPSTDLPPERDAFAHAMATALGEWMDSSPSCRQVLGRVAPGLARALWAAEVAMDVIMADEGPDVLVSDLVADVEPGER